MDINRIRVKYKYIENEDVVQTDMKQWPLIIPIKNVPGGMGMWSSLAFGKCYVAKRTLNIDLLFK